MTTYSAIANTEIDQDSPVTQPLLTAIRDNPIAAFAEADTTSRAAGIVSAASWHPVGAGPLYDFTRDGGVASIETPNFADGWEYRILVRGLSPSAAITTINIDLYREDSAAYVTLLTTSTSAATQTLEVDLEIYLPRVAGNHHVLRGYQFLSSSFANNITPRCDFLGIGHATAQKLLKARIALNTGSIDAGTVWLLRRAEFMSA